MSEEVEIEEQENHSQKRKILYMFLECTRIGFWIILLCYFRTFCHISRWIKQFREGFYIH